MNLAQRVVIAVGLLVIAAMGLFPPWLADRSVRPGWLTERRGYHFVSSPPQPEAEFTDEYLDSLPLLDQLIGVGTADSDDVIAGRAREKRQHNVRIDFATLGLQVSAIVIFTVGVVVAFGVRRKPRP